MQIKQFCRMSRTTYVYLINNLQNKIKISKLITKTKIKTQTKIKRLTKTYKFMRVEKDLHIKIRITNKFKERIQAE